jgi:hypothetical protein
MGSLLIDSGNIHMDMFDELQKLSQCDIEHTSILIIFAIRNLVSILRQYA